MKQFIKFIFCLIIKWFGGLIGPASIPMVLGIVPFWKHCGPVAAFSTILSGLVTFVIVNFGMAEASLAVSVGSPVVVSLITFNLFECVGRIRGTRVSPEIENFMTVYFNIHS